MKKDRNARRLLCAVCAALCVSSSAARLSPRPETWFHLIGGNVSREGITADLEAVKAAGIGGIQLFHGHFGGPWPGVREQIPCLSPKWEDLIRHASEECRRLDLSFKMQNCPGWSMSGGPWVTVDRAMRKLVCFKPGEKPGFGKDDDYREIGSVTFPLEDVPFMSVTFPNPQQISHAWAYEPGATLVLTSGSSTVFSRACPRGAWQDSAGMTFRVPRKALDPAKCGFLARSAHYPEKALKGKISDEPRLDMWEAKAGWGLRDFTMSTNDTPVKTRGERTLVFGHVNARRRNHPAPPEGTGWECDKMSPLGFDAVWGGYLGKLVEAGVRIDGTLVDSWECGTQTWTWKMEEEFAKRAGYALRPWLPALFGYVLSSEAKTEKFLMDWRRVCSDLICENYFGAIARKAREKGMSVQFETAFGDVITGDILKYWKYADIPMCEFWSPHDDKNAFVGSYEFKPVRPCVSAAHVYGKRRVAAEAFTSFKLTWDETFADFKSNADRHFARGVTHLVLHTYTHDPRIGMAPPGSSFGAGIGSPFMRGQCWWPKMKLLTDYFARSCELLESGLPVVDVLRYLGDDLSHKPPEKESVPKGYKADYCNFDALSTRASVRGGRIVFPDGMSYRVLWLPEGVVLRSETRDLIAALEKAGAVVARGSLSALEKKLRAVAQPDLVYTPPPEEKQDDFMWYHRATKDGDVYFVATSSKKGYRGEVRLRPRGTKLRVELPAFGSAFIHVGPGGTRVERPSHPGLEPFSDDAAVKIPVDLAKTSFTAPYLHAPFRTYVTNVTLEASAADKSVRLDFGDVRGVLDVKVNGKHLGSLWAPPFVCDASKALREGVNEIEVEWTGTWRARLLHDAALPERDRRTWTLPYPAK